VVSRTGTRGEKKANPRIPRGRRKKRGRLLLEHPTKRRQLHLCETEDSLSHFQAGNVQRGKKKESDSLKGRPPTMRVRRKKKEDAG